MAPSNPWGKKKTSVPGFSGLKPITSNNDPPTKSQYEEIQENELIALSSIYGDDFRTIDTKQGAWKKSEPCFEIQIKSSDEDIAITLIATLTATYPRTLPLLHVKDDNGLREGTKYKIQKILEAKPRELLGDDQPMIMDIVNACQDVLEDAAEAKVAGRVLPSLEEERALYEAAAAKLAEQQREEEEEQKHLEDEESQRMLGSLVQDELNRQKAKAKETKLKNKIPTANLFTDKNLHPLSAQDCLELDQPISLEIEGSDQSIIFQSVSNRVLIRRGPVSRTFTVRPDAALEAPILILKQTDLDTKPTDPSSFKKQLQALETELDALKKIRHRNILDLLDFKVHKSTLPGDSVADCPWTVSILTEFAEKGSLEEFLDIAGGLGVNKVRSWTIEILDGLRYLHENGILHEDINAGNVLLVRESTGKVHPKLADAGYQRRLHNLVSSKGPFDTILVAKSAYWLAPETANMVQPQFTPKTDVWDFGIVFLQMIFGLTVIRKYSSPLSLADSLTLSDSLNEFVHKLFRADPKKRPRAFELSSSEFLATDAPVLDEDSASPISRFGSITSLLQTTPRRQRHDSANSGAPFSRYKEDFVEEGRLGKGGFGEVVKARKKLDGHIYAIKKITQKSSASLTEVLKEVRLLSQLSHPSVVRVLIEGCLGMWSGDHYASDLNQFSLTNATPCRIIADGIVDSNLGYYNTWTEEVLDLSETDDGLISTGEATTEDYVSNISPGAEDNGEFGASTGGLDFMSSSGYPQIEYVHRRVFRRSCEFFPRTSPNILQGSSVSIQSTNHDHRFGYDDNDDTNEDDDDDDDVSDIANGLAVNDVGEKKRIDLALRPSRSQSRYQRPYKTILYISMEYCEKRTLRDLIRKGLYKDDEEIWRLFRQVLEGLAHIHSLNVVHRDLKPENVFIDSASNVRIGDFGLATSGHYSLGEKVISVTPHLGGDMTRSVGTAFYVAPEVRSKVGGNYTSKVDMYSLGIIFFEMCYRAVIGMERAQVVEGLRLNRPAFPLDFNITDKALQADIIRSLLNYSPKDRPSSMELLQSGRLPVAMESETIRQTLAGLADSRSPYYHKMMNALFSRPIKQETDLAWDMGSASPGAGDLLLQGLVRQNLISIFRHHGAVETPRAGLFPRSAHYGPNVVQLLDPNGTLVQLPYDLTLSHARAIAKIEPSVQRSFAFGPVFRDRQSGGQPQTFGEVDFDIASTDTFDLALKEAEVIKVLDEICTSFPALSSSQMCFHLNHADLLDRIFDFCRIESGLRQTVADTLSKLNVQSWTWQKIKVELRSPHIGVSATSVDDLQRFDFRDTPNKAFQKLKSTFAGTDIFERSASAIAHLRDVVDYTKRFNVSTKIYINPLSSLKEKFCKGGILFSCLYDRKVRDVFAAGGRYDSLIKEHRHRTGSHDDRHAVGFNLAWEKLARIPKPSAKGFLKKAEDEILGFWSAKRCDVLVASHDPAVLRSTGVDIVQQLWSNDVSAELAQDSRSTEDLLTRYREDNHSWIIMIKQDAVLKIKSMSRKEVPDVDIPYTQAVAWIKAEIRERDQREGINQRTRMLQRNTSQQDASGGSDHEQDVRVLVAGTKSKKSNRRNIVEQAQGRAATLVQSFLDGPIAAIETTDLIMELIRETRMSDPESWRKVMHAVPMAERRYLGEVLELMTTLSQQNKDSTRNSFIYNFRTGTCIYYDLAA